MAMEARPNTLDEALRVVSRALRDNKNQVEEKLYSEYRDLREAFMEMAPQVKETIRRVGDETKRKMTDWTRQGMESTREFARDIDESVHRRPWTIIGSVALGTLVMGFLLGRSRK